MHKKTPEVIRGGVTTLGLQLKFLHSQIRLYADVTDPQGRPAEMYTSMEVFSNTMYNFAERLEEALETIKDIQDFIYEKPKVP